VLAADEMCGATYWLDHLLLTVHYQTAVKAAQTCGGYHYLEIGADDTLSRLTRSILDRDTLLMSRWSL
jgi:acyl transferase domain-containing protein